MPLPLCLILIIVPCKNSHAIEKLCNRKLETIQTMLLRKPSFIFICRINILFVTITEGRHTIKFISHIDRILCIIYHSNSLFAFLMNSRSVKKTISNLNFYSCKRFSMLIKMPQKYSDIFTNLLKISELVYVYLIYLLCNSS